MYIKISNVQTIALFTFILTTAILRFFLEKGKQRKLIIFKRKATITRRNKQINVCDGWQIAVRNVQSHTMKNFAIFIFEPAPFCTSLYFIFKACHFTAKSFQDPAFFSQKNTRPCLFLHDPVLPINNESSLTDIFDNALTTESIPHCIVNEIPTP